MQWLQIRKTSPLKLYYKYSLSDDIEFRCVNINKRGRNFDASLIALSQLYTEPQRLAHEKYADLQKLLKYVPPVHHTFYKTLPHVAKSKGKQPVTEPVLEDEILYISETEPMD